MNLRLIYGPALLALLPCLAAANSTLNGAKNGRVPLSARSAFPSMSDRKPELVPQALPPRVNYVFAPDLVVNHVADRLAVALESGDASICGKSLCLQPGAWRLLNGKFAVGKKNASKMGVVTPQQLTKEGLKNALEAVFLHDADEIKIAFGAVSQLLKADGGYQVRALTTAEMRKWWVYIAFNIEEPVFVVASKGGKYAFVVGFVDDSTVYVIDELNSLPNLP